MKGSSALVVLALLSVAASGATAPYLTLEWTFDTRESNKQLYVLNLDDNPSLEIVADSERAGMIFGIDRSGKQIWRANIPGIIFDLHARDFPDGKNEILAGTQPRAYSISGSGLTNWWHTVEHEQVGRVHLDDLDNDSRCEPVIGVLGGFLGNKILVLDENGEKTLKIGLKSAEFPSVIRASDIKGDFHKELIVGFGVYSVNTRAESMELGYTRDATVRAYDLEGGLLWSHPTSGGVKDIEVADINGDGREEIIAGSNGMLYALKPDGTLLWSYATGTLVNDLKIRDVDKDGSPEVVLAADRIHVVSSNGSKIWKSDKIGVVTSVDAADFDGDGAMEYVAGSGGVMVFNSAGEKVWSSADIKYTTNVIAADLDGDGFTEVVSGSGDSTVRMFSSKPYLASTQAARFFKDAVVLYDAGDLSSALEKAKKSKLLFEALASVDGVDNATKLITKIEKRSQADELLKKSQDNYDARALSEALDYANQSKAAYESIGMDSGAKAAEEVISKVNTLPKAQSNLAEARRLYALGDYITAGEEAAKAAELFEWLADENGTKEARELANKTAPYVEAEARLDSARQHLSDGLYSEALTEIAAAKVTYESLDYDEGVSSAASLEREVRFARLKKNKIFWIEMVLIVPMTMLAAILLTAVYIVRKKQGKTLLGAQHGLGRESQLIRSKTNMGKTGRKRL